MNERITQNLFKTFKQRGFLTLRFNFPFAEARKTRSDSMPVLRRALQWDGVGRGSARGSEAGGA